MDFRNPITEVAGESANKGSLETLSAVDAVHSRIIAVGAAHILLRPIHDGLHLLRP